MTAPRLLVLGIGNLLLGDEGVGVHAVRRLEKEGLPPDVALVDGGTGGFHLLSYFEDYNPIVMIDATMDGRPPGTVALIQPRFASEFPRALSAHDIGLRDLIESAALLRPLPRILLITVSIASMQPMEIELSPPLRDALPAITDLVRKIVDSETDKSPAPCYVIDQGTKESLVSRSE
jgi:hydrogenase maturation protease